MKSPQQKPPAQKSPAQKSPAQSLESLEPAAVWKFFRGIAAVPRPSKREGKIREHVLDLAAAHELEAIEDATGNIVVRVPATPGAESAPITVLQAHLDMVCEKNSGTEHDFDSDPITLVRARDDAGEEIVRAQGTTLGADNGIGVAMALAAATEPDVRHGPLELLFTVDEESGMTGAKALTPDSFAGRILLNLDSEEDDSIYIGCAGGLDTDLRWELELESPPEDARGVRISVSGLRGGHSGCDIHENRGNAIKLLARVLLEMGDDVGVASLRGGTVRNAIPREAEAVVAITPRGLSALGEATKRLAAAVRSESFESDVSIRHAPVDAEEIREVTSPASSARLIAALHAIPSGVLAMHPRIPQLVATSNNLSTVRTERDGQRVAVTCGCLSRSSLGSAIDLAKTQLAAIARLSGARAHHFGGYPGWEPNPDSPLLAMARALYEELFGSPPKVAAIHAGLECGIIGDAVGEIDMVSFGPRIEGAHSPDERVYVESVEKSWRFLVAVLAKLAEGGGGTTL